MFTEGFKRQGAEKVLPELIDKYELNPDLVSIDTRTTDILHGLYLFYKNEIIGIFESSIRQDGLSYFMDTIFHPAKDAHLIVSKINVEKEYFDEKVKKYRTMMNTRRTETPKQQRDRINRFRCG
jgi:hypothetical protein